MTRRGDGIYLRGRTWWLDFRHDGERHVKRLGRNIGRTTARELAQVYRARFLKGEVGIGRKKKDMIFEKAAEQFLEWAAANKRPKTLRAYGQCVRRLKESFAGKKLSQIHPFQVEKHKQRRVREGAPVAANRELTVLKALYNRCIDWKKFEGENPVRKVKLLKESAGRVRFLGYEEEQQLLKSAQEPLRTIILLGTNAGLRIEAEALSLTWGSVDLRRRELIVEAAYAKNGEMRAIPLNSVLCEALTRLQRLSTGTRPEDYVFTSRNGARLRSIRTTLSTASRKAGLGHVTPHSFRHTFASRLTMAGVDTRTIQELGGWREIDMLKRYAHLSPTHKYEAVEKIANNSQRDSQRSKGVLKAFPTNS